MSFRHALICLLSLAMGRLGAQGSISGTVTDLRGSALPDAEVTVAERRVRTDSVGKFRIGNLPAASYNVRVRRLGYLVFELKARVTDNAETPLRVALEPRPVMLDTVRITAECHRFQFSGFVCRRRGNTQGGIYFDANAIDSANPRYPKDIFREVPGFRVIAVRGGLGLQLLTHTKCVVEIVNGRKPTLQNPMARWPKDLLGVEIYKDVNDVPREYRHFVDPPGRCGLVNYWTSVRPRR